MYHSTASTCTTTNTAVATTWVNCADFVNAAWQDYANLERGRMLQVAEMC
jgi:hypothetical protein